MSEVKVKAFIFCDNTTTDIDYYLDLCSRHALDPFVISVPKLESVNRMLVEKKIPHKVTNRVFGHMVIYDNNLFGRHNLVFYSGLKLKNEKVIDDLKKCLTMGKKRSIVIGQGQTLGKYSFMKNGYAYAEPKKPQDADLILCVGFLYKSCIGIPKFFNSKSKFIRSLETYNWIFE